MARVYAIKDKVQPLTTPESHWRSRDVRAARPFITGLAADNRKMLVEIMSKHGFRNFEKEWRHFNVIDEHYPDIPFDFPIEAKPMVEQ